MDVEQALTIIDTLLKPERLIDVEELLFCQSWLGKSYYEIAQEFDYDPGYLRVVGSRLWKRLSNTVGQKITKNNFRSECYKKLSIRGY